MAESAPVSVKSLVPLITKLNLVQPHELQEAQAQVLDDPNDGQAFLRYMERKGYLTAFQIDKLLKGDRTGYFLGPYRLLYKIASGTFGRVWRGDDPQTGRVVAIKVLRKRWSEDPANIELFEREGRVGMTLHHPGIVEILLVGQDAATRQFFFVMEFIEGGNLRDLLVVRKRFEPREALRLMDDMASALAYAFARGVTHRDIKMTNILISTTGQAKLVDFGLAQIYSSSRRFIEEDDVQVARTVDYAGLERTTGVKPGDTRSDIYFLGAVLYEMITGRPPFPPTRNKQARMQRDRFENVPPIRSEEVNGPPSVIRLIETMMALNPQLRYQTPAQLQEAIRVVRLDVEGGGNGDLSALTVRAAAAGPSVFILESDLGLQDTLRDKLKKIGYRVLMAADPERAVERFAQQPYAALVVDIGTIQEPGLEALREIFTQASRRKLPLRAFAIFSEDQEELAATIDPKEPITVLTRPLKLGQLVQALQQHVPVENKPAGS